MHKIVGATTALALIAGGSAAALAEEFEGEVVSYDEPSKVLTLQNGESYTVSDGVAEFRFHEGDVVRVTVEEQDGEMVVTELEKISEGAEVESGAEALEEEGVQ